MRRPVRLALGELPFTLLPDGRVLVDPPMEDVPLGAVAASTAVYPSLRAFVASVRTATRSDGPGATSSSSR